MICTNNKINKLQLAFILLGSIVGVEMLSLPNLLATEVATDGWIVILIAGLISMILTVMITSVSVKYPGKSMVEFGREIVPAPLANIITTIYLVEFVIIGSVILKFFNEVMGIFLLSRTPYQVINMTMMVLAVYMVRSGIESMGRLFMITTVLMVVPVIIVGLATAPDISIENFLPALNTAPSKILKTIPKSLNAFSGFQIMFFTIFFVKEDKKSIRKYNMIGVAAVTLLYLSIYMVSLGKYGTTKVQAQLWPVMSLMRSIQIPSAFLENIDALVMIVWIVSVFTSLATTLFGSSFIFSRLLKTDELKPFVIPISVAMYSFANLPENLAKKISYANKILSMTSIVTILITPILYFTITKIKENREVNTNK